MALAALILAAWLAPNASAQQRIAITGDRLSGIVLPVDPLDGPIELGATRTWTWTVDDTKRLVLEGDVTVHIAGNDFRAQWATVWMNRLPTAAGVVNQIAVYFENLQNPMRRSGIGAGGRQLLVTASARGPVGLTTVTRDEGRPPTSPELARGEERLALHIRGLLGDPPHLAMVPRIDRPAARRRFIPVPGGSLDEADLDLPTEVELPALETDRSWLHDPGALLRVAFGTMKIVPGPVENTIIATDGIVVEYFGTNQAEELSQLTLVAERAVIFTDPGSLEEMAQRELSVETIRGIYLEGDVRVSANDDEYSVRAPHVYYDFESDRAVMVNAVLRTYDRARRVPVYARAEELRQIASDQWDATGVRVTTSEFAIGHLSLGAERATVTRRPVRPNDQVVTSFDMKNIALRAGTTPFFWWPGYTGTVQDVPLQGLSAGYSSDKGAEIETRWDLYSLLGIERPDGTDAELRLDGFTKRGPALGLDLRHHLGDSQGALDLYGLYDEGEDLTSAGETVTPPQKMRGVALAEYREQLSREWSFQAQAAFISDPSFISSWRENDFAERREYETSVYLKEQKDRTALTLLTKYDLNDFISNSPLLASQQYTVNKLPELAHRRLGEPVFADAFSYSGEWEYARAALVFESSSAAELGVRPLAFGPGVPPTTPISDVLYAQGLRQKWVNRFDTRHELSWTGEWNHVKVTPFVVGRITAWDDDFVEYAGNEDQLRFYGAAGLRLATQFQHVDNEAENRLLNIHRLRHIIEPNATFWYGYSTIDQSLLPVYDTRVESLTEGAVMRLGLDNTWQTQRGGPGRWESVDVFTFKADYVAVSADVDRESPTPQFFDYRPEYSQLGDHIYANGTWLVSDTLSFSGEGTWDLDDSVMARGALGAELRHSPVLTTYIEYRVIEISENELLGIGWDYRMSKKYRLVVTPAWDFQEGDFRTFQVNVVRSFPDFDLTVRVLYDQIRDQTTFGAAIGLVSF